MIVPALLATPDDQKRVVLHPLELSLFDLYYMAAVQGLLAGYEVPASVPAKAADIARQMLAERAKQ